MLQGGEKSKSIKTKKQLKEEHKNKIAKLKEKKGKKMKQKDKI